MNSFCVINAKFCFNYRIIDDILRRDLMTLTFTVAVMRGNKKTFSRLADFLIRPELTYNAFVRERMLKVKSGNAQLTLNANF